MMAHVSEELLRTLRQKFQTAYAAYQNCVIALALAESKGVRPSQELLHQEAKALRELTDARNAYRDALLEMDQASNESTI